MEIPLEKAHAQISQQMMDWALQLDWNQFEMKHDFIQIAFPNLMPGMAHRELTPTPQIVQYLKSQSSFLKDLHYDFQLMLLFYGCVLIDEQILIANENRFLKYLIQGGAGKHNHLRITRILHSLNLFGLIQDYHIFKKWILEVGSKYPQAIPSTTLQYWQKA